MAYNKLDIAVILSAEDRMSNVIKGAVSSSISDLESLALKYGGARLLKSVIDDYTELESSSARLNSTLLQDGGRISSNFEELNDLAIQLGNRLPGTTSDIQNMFSALAKGGVQEESILQGIGKASAEFAVVSEMGFQEAATFAAKMKMATGTADKDMTKLMDVIQRTINLGVRPDEMQYAFANSGGKLAAMGLQGVEASKGISILYSALIRAGNSGERVGTNMTMVFDQMMNSKKMGEFNAELGKYGVHMDFFNNKGKFKGVENMVVEMEKLNKLNPIQRADAVRTWLGPGADARFIESFARLGRKGYNELMYQMARQATIDDRIKIITETIGSKMEAAMGNLTNMNANLGESISDAFGFKQGIDDAGAFFAAVSNGLNKLNKEDYFKKKTALQMFWDALGLAGSKSAQAGAATVLDRAAWVIDNVLFERSEYKNWKQHSFLGKMASGFEINDIASDIIKKENRYKYKDQGTSQFKNYETMVTQKATAQYYKEQSPVSVSYAPTISFHGPVSKEDVVSANEFQLSEVKRMVTEVMSKRARTSFNNPE